MKKLLYLAIPATIFAHAPTSDAFAAICFGGGYCGVDDTNIQPTNCKTMTSGTAYNGYCIYSCNTCQSGYKIVSTTTTKPGCTVTYNDCTLDSGGGGGGGGGSGDGGIIIDPITPGGQFCISDSSCTSGTGTTTNGCTISTKTGKCVSKSCTYSTTVTCAANCYNSSTSALSRCISCPSDGGVSGVSAGGNIGITGCYIPAGKTHTDSIGNKYTFDAKCNYSN